MLRILFFLNVSFYQCFEVRLTNIKVVHFVEQKQYVNY